MYNIFTFCPDSYGLSSFYLRICGHAALGVININIMSADQRVEKVICRFRFYIKVNHGFATNYYLY